MEGKGTACEPDAHETGQDPGVLQGKGGRVKRTRRDVSQKARRRADELSTGSVGAQPGCGRLCQAAIQAAQDGDVDSCDEKRNNATKVVETIVHFWNTSGKHVREQLRVLHWLNGPSTGPKAKRQTPPGGRPPGSSRPRGLKDLSLPPAQS